MHMRPHFGPPHRLPVSLPQTWNGIWPTAANTATFNFSKESIYGPSITY